MIGRRATAVSAGHADGTADPRGTPRETLFVNVGHGALGSTLAAGAARLVVEAIVGRTAPIDPRPFAPR